MADIATEVYSEVVLPHTPNLGNVGIVDLREFSDISMFFIMRFIAGVSTDLDLSLVPPDPSRCGVSLLERDVASV
jgi:hypothetical protein